MKLRKNAQSEAVVQPSRVESSKAQCPRCKSVRLQRGYKHTPIIFRLVRRYELLCNNCSLEFKEFDLWDGLRRTPSTNKQSQLNLRRVPRYKVHLPATISLAERAPTEGKLIFSKASRGHCDVISKVGMALSFVGSKFGKEDFAKTGRLLFVGLMLPNGPVDALITTVTHERATSEEGRPTWFIGAIITHMTESDTALLVTYVNEVAKRVPVLLHD